MNLRHLASRALAVAGAAAICLAPGVDARAQTRGKAGAASQTNAPRTSWGDPDLQGVWTNATTTPLERPDRFADRTTLTDEERASLDAQDASNADRAPTKGQTGTYNDFWFDRGKRTNQTSLVVDPPNGKLPGLTPQGRMLQDAIGQVRQAPPSAPEDLSLFERCITRSLPGAMLPGFYNHNYHILQAPGYVAILVEMIHDVRIIPTDGRPHLGSGISQWLGDSRGRWDGKTLVVETTNVRPAQELRPSRTVYGGSEKLKIVERFTRVDADTLDYKFTVSDPNLFTSAWTASTPMAKVDVPIFEYACHEGNHSIENMLRGARQAEREAAEASRR
jgi:hypothetical protein